MIRKSRDRYKGLLRAPSDLALGPNDALFVSDRSLNAVYPIGIDGVGPPWKYRDWFASKRTSTYGIDVDHEGSLLVADLYFHAVRRVTPEGKETYLAGSGRTTADPGSRENALVNRPIAVAAEADGTVLVAALHGDFIWRIREDVTPQVVAGTGERGFNGDGGAAALAQLNSPRSIAIAPSGQILLAEKFSNRIRLIDEGGIIRTLAGDGRRGREGDGGPGDRASLAGPEGVAVDQTGRVWIADTGNHCVRMLDVDGQITTAAGTGDPGTSQSGEQASTARLNAPRAVIVDKQGRAYVADTGNRRICALDFDGTLTVLA